MTHAATAASVRTISLSRSTAFWAGLLFLMMAVGPKIAAVLPPAEPPVIEGIELAPPPKETKIVPSTTKARSLEGVDVVAAELPPALDPVAVEAGEPVAIVPAPPPTIVNPVWLRKPSSRELAQFYPSLALRRDRTGAVRLDCIVHTDGALACRVLEETPAGYGFAEAALRISQAYRMVPATQDGQPVQARYQLRVPFELN